MYDWPPILLGALFLLGLLILSVAVGERLLRMTGLNPSDSSTHWALAAGIGLGSLQAIPFTLFALGLGRPMAFRLGGAILFAVLLPGIPRIIRSFLNKERHPPERSWPTRVIGFCALVCILFAFIRAVCPPTDDDGISYHLTSAIRWLQAGRFILLPTLTYSNWPMSTESLFAFTLGIHPQAPVSAIQFYYGALSIFSVYALGTVLSNRISAFAGLTFMLAYAVFWDEMAAAHVDLGTTVYTTLALICLTQAQTDQVKRRRWLRLSGIFAGLAATTKLNGLWVIVAMAITIVFDRKTFVHIAAEDAVSEHEYSGMNTRLRIAAVFLGPAILAAAPWFIKTWALTGNPLYPAAYGLFGGREWTAEGSPRMQHYFLLFTTPWGMEPTRLNLYIGKIALVAAGLSLCFVVFRRWSRGPSANLARFSSCFTAFVLLGGGYNLRFLLPIYPALAVCFGLLFKDARRWSMPALACLSIGLTARLLLRQAPPNLPSSLSAALGLQTRSDYLRASLPDYAMSEYVNSHLSDSDRVLIATWEEQTAYYRPFAYRANYWLQDSIHYNSQNRLQNDLARLGVTHLVFKPVDEPWCAKSSICRGRNDTETAALRIVAERQGTKIAEIKGYSLFKLDLSSNEDTNGRRGMKQ